MGCSDKIHYNISIGCGFEENKELKQKRFDLYRIAWLKNVMNKLSYSQQEAEEAFIRIHKRV